MKKQTKSNFAVKVSGLYKSYGELKVLRDVSFDIKKGSVLALLGPNGAGKTTTIKILSTLLTADRGRAQIENIDVFQNPDAVKAKIGLTGQFAAVDEYLTGQENLVMVARLYRLDKKTSIQKASELLRQFDLIDASNRAVKTYSGGMKRRLDLAMSLIASPPVIFLDEPTTGLDPRSRLTMWGIIKDLVANGTTILLTTQDMDEADHLADRIIVIDQGKVIAEGTADLLKKKVGADRLVFVISKKSEFEKAKKVVTTEKPDINLQNRTLTIKSTGGVTKLKKILNLFENSSIEIDSVSLRRPSLDDVFLSLTGHKAITDEKSSLKGAKYE